ncbi:MAG TPA: hypothetical protein V6D19_08725 [Stenomitos sp.]
MAFSKALKYVSAISITATLLAITTISSLSNQPRWSSNLLLFNRLESLRQVQNSVVGPDFKVHAPGPSKIYFVPGIRGKALATTGGSPDSSDGGAYLTINYKDFFGKDITQGEVSLWLKKTIEKTIPYRTPIVGIFGTQPYGSQGPTGNEGYVSISATWNDGLSGKEGINFSITQNTSKHEIITINDPDWNSSVIPINQWYHYRFVWNIKGIQGGTEKMQLWRNDLKIANYTGTIQGIAPPNYSTYTSDEVRILGNHHLDRHGNRPILYLDELQVRKFASH